MRLILLGILFMSLTSCGFKARVPDYVDPAFSTYLADYLIDKERFTGDYGLYRNINIVFRSLERPRIGECQIRSDSSKRIIRIDPIFWFEILTEIDREILIYHELGHCDLDQDHRDNGIMVANRGDFDTKLYEGNRDLYLEELFSPSEVSLQKHNHSCNH